MRITVELLEKLGACEDQVEQFAAMWPRGCEVTLRRALRAARAGLDVGWLAPFLLSRADRPAYVDAESAATHVWEAAQHEAEDADESYGATYESAMKRADCVYNEAIARAFVAALGGK